MLLPKEESALRDAQDRQARSGGRTSHPSMHSCRSLCASLGSCLAPFRYSLIKKPNKQTQKKQKKPQTPKPTLPQAPPGLLLNRLAFCQSRQLSAFTDRLYYSRRDLAQGEKEKDEVAERSPVRQRAITSAHFLIAPQTRYLDKSLF